MTTEIFKHFYSFFKRLAPGDGELVWLSGALTSVLSQEGHSCLPLSEFAGKNLSDAGFDLDSECNFTLPGLEQLRKQLVGSVLIGGRQNSKTPLILDDSNRLYLSRNFDYESRLSHTIAERVKQDGYAAKDIEMPLKQLFGELDCEQVDWQRVAAATAALKKICIVSGGPGTGKTFTVVKIMVLLQMLSPDCPLRFGLTAPTGKAAGRLQESIQASLQGFSEKVRKSLGIDIEAQTVHRLLGTQRNSPYFRHGKDNPLAIDVLIVDEVSMVDLALMVKLLEAMPVHGRVIMLGDKDQLSSVEAGRVLADICDGSRNSFSESFVEQLFCAGAVSKDICLTGSIASPIKDSLVFLEKSYRFGTDTPIGRLAQAVISGNATEASSCLVDENRFVETAFLQTEMLAEKICSSFSVYLKERDPLKALNQLKQFRILCAHRHGSWGVLSVNQWVETVLLKSNRIEKSGDWYAGRPVMITGNHYSIGLFNGDVGISMLDDEGRLRVWFDDKDGQVRSFSPSRIPDHETAYALTVHKSQGSEFDHVVLILPDHASRLITRELLYTAITRAKDRFELWGNRAVFEAGVRKITLRNTGLSDKLASVGI